MSFDTGVADGRQADEAARGAVARHGQGKRIGRELKALLWEWRGKEDVRRESEGNLEEINVWIRTNLPWLWVAVPFVASQPGGVWSLTDHRYFFMCVQATKNHITYYR
jgi:hypothetical protein